MFKRRKSKKKKRKKGKRKSEFYIKKAIYPLYAFEAQGICSFFVF